MDTNHGMEQQEMKRSDGGKGFIQKLSGWRDGFRRMNRRKKALAIILPAAVLTAAGLILFGGLHNVDTVDDRAVLPEGLTFGADAVIASGLTSIGITEDKYSLDFLETPLYVEENYLSVGDEVEEGTRAFRISEKSLREAEKELTEEAEETEYAYRQGVIDDMTDRLEAEADYRKSEVNLEYAQAEYDNALSEYAAQVSDLEAQVTEAQELADEYADVVNNNYYYTYYNVKELQEIYYDNFAYLMQLYEEWDIASLEDRENSQGLMNQDTSGVKMDGGKPAAGSGSVEGNSTAAGSGSEEGNGTAAGSGSEEGNGTAAGNGSEEGNGTAAGNGSEEGNGTAAGNGSEEGNGTAAGNGSEEGNGTAAGSGSMEGSGTADRSGTGDNSGAAGDLGSAADAGEPGSIAAENGRNAADSSETGETLFEKWLGTVSSLSSTGSDMAGTGGSASGGSSQTVSSAADSSAISAGGQSGQVQNTVGNDKLSVYQLFEELVERNGEEYELAAENYEKDTAMAAASLNQAKSNLAVLEADLADAKLEYEKQKIAAEQQYDTTVSESETAELTYRTELDRLDEELSALKEAKDEAEENLELFRTALSDGYFKTSGAGTVVMNRVSEGSYLSGDGILLAYGDPEVFTAEASVDQSQIASVEVGESGYVMINGYGNFRGTVRSMDPNAASDSRSSVTYTVIIELEGETEGLESNLTATVYLGLSEEEIQRMEQMSQRSEKGSEADAGNGANPEEKDSTGGGPAFPEGGGREWLE